MIKKRILSYYLIIHMLILSISMSFCVPVKASTLSQKFVENVQAAKDARDAVLDYFDSTSHMNSADLDKLFKACGTLAGFITGYTVLSLENMYDIYASKIWGGETVSGTQQEVTDSIGDKFVNGVTITDDSVSLDATAKQILQAYCEWVMSQSGYTYLYSCNIALSATSFSNGDLYRAIISELNAHQNNYLCLLQRSGSDFVLYFIPNKGSLGFIQTAITNQLTIDSACYSMTNWNQLKYNDIEGVIIKKYNSSTHYFESQSSDNNNTITQILTADKTKVFDSSFINASGYRVTFTNNMNYTVKVYKTLNDLKNDTLGRSPYYLSDKWQNFINSGNTSITYNNDNSNNYTYGDVISYVDSFNTQNGDYPSPQQIEIIINQNTPDDGGGSGGGGGGGGSGGGSSIWDFLSQIGDALGNLISNLGSVLAELIQGISEIISSLFEAIPTVFNDFLAGLLGWLPVELRALITLSISAMVIVGLIKMFKG